MLKNKNKRENSYEFQNVNQGIYSWEEFIEAEIEDSQDNFSLDREEDFWKIDSTIYLCTIFINTKSFIKLFDKKSFFLIY